MNNIYPIKTKVSKEEREGLLKQRAVLVWFTGLSGSGKSTLAVQLEAQLYALGYKTYLLDGDRLCMLDARNLKQPVVECYDL